MLGQLSLLGITQARQDTASWKYPSQKEVRCSSPYKKGFQLPSRCLRMSALAESLRRNTGTIALNCNSFLSCILNSIDDTHDSEMWELGKEKIKIREIRFL